MQGCVSTADDASLPDTSTPGYQDLLGVFTGDFDETRPGFRSVFSGLAGDDRNAKEQDIVQFVAAEN